MLQPRLGRHGLGDIDGVGADHHRLPILIDNGKTVGNPLMYAIGVTQGAQGLQCFSGLND